jgi:integrase/recombinase XerD
VSLKSLLESAVFAKQVGGRTGRTLSVYRFWIDRLLAEIPDEAALSQPLALAKFFAGQQARGLAPATVHQGFRTIRCLLRWGQAQKLLGFGAFAGIDTPRVPATLPRVPTADELRAVVRACPPSLTGRRDRATVMLMVDSGLRASPVVALNCADLDATTGTLRVHRDKGQTAHLAFVQPGTLTAIAAYHRLRGPLNGEEPLLATEDGRRLTLRRLAHILSTLSVRAGLPKARHLHPHALRHAAATAWARAGLSTSEIQRLLNHRTMQTTLRYISLVESDARRAHARADVIHAMGLDDER